MENTSNLTNKGCSSFGTSLTEIRKKINSDVGATIATQVVACGLTLAQLSLSLEHITHMAFVECECVTITEIAVLVLLLFSVTISLVDSSKFRLLNLKFVIMWLPMLASVYLIHCEITNHRYLQSKAIQYSIADDVDTQINQCFGYERLRSLV
ncbi:hypothetical protein [Photobacterium leiognathi]|uniref:hypothetical protein n=1 Tax=Photobacterium leiognathi TaxID=553611 RepID=UPI002981A2F1|nr:hypothetical protein [Photobacterium leiognathi]